MIEELRKRGLLPFLERAAKEHHSTVEKVIGFDRHKSHVDARRAAAVSLRGCGLSYPEIGRLLGGRDHTTIMHYCKGRVSPGVAYVRRCRTCGGLFGDHLSREPHANPAKQCEAFVEPALLASGAVA